ncbi:1,2-dihydroxy-3-keto-5-methylthiopentene dioxygenase [Mycena sanguinolenta]|uniref:acireductone dioxygenase (Fe(2+)-requiring) n=1 Tax=Mycena sanguinolenta TaxID=230812 RepID=A0A8H6Y7E5_9AGAR|nr:1,2-dihydroxy-3-keto-5-methylthiopentene dioxygenase [Mycena sanguinolenta]
MHAYYFENLPTDQRLPHTTDPLRPVSAETLAKLGVLSWHVLVPAHAASRLRRGYKNRDVINVSREGMGAVYERSGSWSVANPPNAEMPTDAWIRIAVTPGDLLVFPAGIYHRFTLDTKDQIRALRLFKVSRLTFRLLSVSTRFRVFVSSTCRGGAFPQCRLLAAPCSGSTQCGA